VVVVLAFLAVAIGLKAEKYAPSRWLLALLADDDPLFEYYLPGTSWRQWASVYSITLPSGFRQATGGTPGPYLALIDERYFNVIILAFTDRPPLDAAIARYLGTDHDYRFAGTFRCSNPGVPGGFRIWVYRGA
jgi:hypothetical protein